MRMIDEIKTWQGDTVTDREGEKIGSIDEVYADRESGEPKWLAVKTDLFGNDLSFVPVAEAARTGEDVRVPYEKAHVKNAPHVDVDGGISETDEADLYRHYGLDHGLRTDDVLPAVRKEQIDAVRKAARR